MGKPVSLTSDLVGLPGLKQSPVAAIEGPPPLDCLFSGRDPSLSTSTGVDTFSISAANFLFKVVFQWFLIAVQFRK